MADKTMVLTLAVWDGPELRDVDLEHVIARISEGYTSGELCPSDGEDEGRGWWDYSEQESVVPVQS